MKVHQLAVFWRSQHTRCFTSWHFQPAAGERAAKRVSQFLALLPQLTTLQIYGAAIDEEPLPIYQAKPAPTTGTAERLQVDLYPDKDLNPRLGINLIKFSIPGPIQDLMDLVESKSYNKPYWILLEKEVWPYLCLPDGTKVKRKGEQLYRAEIAYLDSERQPKPDHPPLDAAISRTTEDLEIAKRSFQQLKTPHERQRVEKYQARLDDLYTWQHLEKGFFEQAASLPLLAPQPKVKRATAGTPDFKTEKRSDLVDKSPAWPSPLTPAEYAPIAPVTAQESLSQDESGSKGETPQMSETMQSDQQKTPSQQPLYLPVPLSPEQVADWQGIPPEHFRSAQMWMHRALLKQEFLISDRSYFRWISNLSRHGLQRSLQAEQDQKVRLFYRPDIDKAVTATKADAANHPRRGRKPKALSAPSVQQQSMAPTSTQASPAAASSQQPASLTTELLDRSGEVAALRTQLQAQDVSISQLQSELALIKHQLSTIKQKQAVMAEQLPQARIIEILAQFARFDQLTAVLKRLNSQINKLSVHLANKKTKSKSKTTAKPAARTKKSSAKAKAKAATSSKGKPNRRPPAPARQAKK
jgi:hypothetical protein